MNYLIIPRANPVRIRPISSTVAGSVGNIEIDWVKYFPRFDLMTQREKYQQGITPGSWYIDFLKGNEISFQLQIDEASGFRKSCYVYKEGVALGTNINGVDITPVGWVGFKVFKFNYTFPSAGFYYFVWQVYDDNGILGDYQLKSDIINVHNDAVTDKMLVEIKYRKADNSLNYVFGGNYSKIYSTGLIKKIVPQVETSSFDEDNFTLLNTRSSNRMRLTLTDTHIDYIDTFSKIFECPDILVNGMPVAIDGGIEEQETEKSDIVNLVINLKSTIDNNNMYYF